MGDVILDISVSLDGFAAGRDVSQALPLGEAGHRLHSWMFGDAGGAPTGQDRQVAARSESIGAYVIGRRMFDVGVKLWGEDGAFRRPCFVVTTRGEDQVVKGPTTFTFVTGGIGSALRQARTAAGDRDVCVIGGPTLARQYVRSGLVDRLNVHLVPVLLGAGTKLFDDVTADLVELENTAAVHTPFATHLVFRVQTGAEGDRGVRLPL
jgi:dihydrofolate reductase